MKKVLIFQGGWNGHQPALVSKRFARLLSEEGYECEIYDTQDCLADGEKLKTYDLIVSCWTMGTINGEYVDNISNAVAAGTGLAGCHGGMCDSFRDNVHWQFMTGGQWVAHPGNDGTEYVVNICPGDDPITAGLEDFPVKSEHYYLHVDPANEVLATTRFPLINNKGASNRECAMPVAWKKRWGHGRVFYCALGHHDDVFDNSPNAEIMMKRGMIWAAEGKQYAIDHNLSAEDFVEKKRLY